MKDFLLIANKNCITYKEFFPFIKDRKDKHNDETWRVQNPYIITKGKPYCPYNRIFIKKNFEIDGCLYGDHTIIDGIYIKGHTPEIDGKHLYSRILIRRKQ